MAFPSIEFFLFLPLVFLLYRLAGSRWGWIVLLASSYVFYAALKDPYLLAALATVSGVAYVAGVAMGRDFSPRARGGVFWAAVAVVLGILAWMKYVPILSGGIHSLSPLSIGVSYFVFQAVSYLVDVYAGMEAPEDHPGYLALYLGFFPKLLQGPIERAGDLLPQLRSPRPFSYEDAREGLLLFAWGLFKKVVIADRLAFYVNMVYGNVHAYTGLPLLLATYFYAGQIYYDFSGYTDMALGVARLFGVRLTQNFNSPYMAISVADFWRRWHISLSRWLQDYIFKPLQMRFRDWKTYGNALAIIATFVVCGVWHGASVNFLLWGFLHGIFMAASLLTAPLREWTCERLGITGSPLRKGWQIAVTFHLVCFSFIFFRASNLGDAVYVVTHLASGTAGVGRLLLAQGKRDLYIAIVSVAIVAAVSSWDPDTIAGKRFRALPAWVRWAAYYTLIATLLWYAAGRSGQFIYFQF